MIPFNIPLSTHTELTYLQDAILRQQYSGDGHYTRLCEAWLECYTGTCKALLTTSCTHALEICAILCDIQPGDEVIMSSFNFVSAANAFVLRGAKIVFVDVRPDTMNIDESLIETAIGPRTKVILAMHYGGVGCDMDRIMELAERHQLLVVEDAAHALGSNYKGRHLGTIGHLGALSFHATKNIHCGEGGALLINVAKFETAAEIIREKGTNRREFERKEVSRYTWQNIGSSYLASELSAAFLYAQLQHCEIVIKHRRNLWRSYYDRISSFTVDRDSLPYMPVDCDANGHIFFIKCQNSKHRAELMKKMERQGVQTSFHYIPLHSSPGGKKFARFHNSDNFTSRESERLLRLPIYFDLIDTEMVCNYLEESLNECTKSRTERVA